MAIAIFPRPKARFFDDDGTPLAGGKVYFFEPGTAVAKDTYTDEGGGTPNANPVILDANGRAEIWLNGFYDVQLDRSDDTTVWTVENISGAAAATTTDISEWLSPGDTPTYISATQFSVEGDKRTTYQVGRRVKCTVTAGTVYGVITVSDYTSLTTVTVVLDSGTLDSGLSVVEVGMLTVTNPSLPKTTYTILDATALEHAVTAQQINKGELTHDTDETSSKAISSTFGSSPDGWSLGTGWAISGGKANKSAGTGSDLTYDVVTSVLDLDSVRYRVTYTVSNWTAGEITTKIGSSAATTRTVVSNQTFTEDIVSPSSGQPHDLIFTADASFDGSLDDVSVEAISDVFTGTLAPAITAHVAGMEVSLLVNNSNGGTAPTLDMGGGADTIKRLGSYPLEIGDIKAGQIHKFISDGTDWILQNPYEPEVGIMSQHRGLIVIPNSGTPLTQVDIDADEVITQALNGKVKRVSSVNLTIDATTIGANGLDTSALANNTWYHSFVITDGITVAALLSTSPTAPIMPSGYHYKAFVSSFKTDGSAEFIPFRQEGKILGSDAANDIIDSTDITADPGGGDAGDTWNSLDITSYFPPTAKRIRFRMGSSSNASAVGLSPRSDGEDGLLYRGASDTDNTFGGIIPAGRPSVITGDIRYAGTSYYYSASIIFFLQAMGWELE